MLGSALDFYCRVDSVYSKALRTLGHACFTTYIFSSLDCTVFYNALIGPGLQHLSAEWNNLDNSGLVQ